MRFMICQKGKGVGCLSKFACQYEMLRETTASICISDAKMRNIFDIEASEKLTDAERRQISAGVLVGFLNAMAIIRDMPELPLDNPSACANAKSGPDAAGVRKIIRDVLSVNPD